MGEPRFVITSFLFSTMKFALVFSLLFAVAFGQLTQIILIDDFTIGANSQKAVVDVDQDNDFFGPGALTDQSTVTDLTQCDRLLGCSRDMQMSVTQGFAGRSFQSEIFRIPDTGDNLFEAEWVVANPKNLLVLLHSNMMVMIYLLVNQTELV